MQRTFYCQPLQGQTIASQEYSRPAALRVITNATGEACAEVVSPTSNNPDIKFQEELICRASLLPVEEIPSIGSCQSWRILPMAEYEAEVPRHGFWVNPSFASGCLSNERTT